MTSIPRFVLRWGLISALALGGATLLIGPERVAAGLACVRTKAQSVVDLAIDNPMALRRQLEELAQEYPDRIAVVQGEIAEVGVQIAQYERDSEISGRVVAMSTEDLIELKTLITRAQEVEGEGRAVAVRFDGVRFNLNQAYGEAQRINKVRESYGDRQATNRHQLDLLNQQKSRLVEILVRLEDDYNTFETQMWQLDRQIDAIERNDRLIEMTEQMHATLASYEKWGTVGNLKQLEAKLAELRMKQEAQLAYLDRLGTRQDYEKRARYELETDSSPESPFGDVFEQETDTEVEIKDDSFAFLGPVIVE